MPLLKVECELQLVPLTPAPPASTPIHASPYSSCNPFPPPPPPAPPPPPHRVQLKVYDLANLSLKFDRHMDAEVVDFQILSDDYSKAAFLCADRSVSFHARFGSYFKVRKV